MPLTYTNRIGITYTLYRKTGVDGKQRHVFARNPVGEPVAEMPAGFRVSESPNGIVSVARDRPPLIRPEEIAAVEAALGQHERAGDYRIVVKSKRLEFYAKVGAPPRTRSAIRWPRRPRRKPPRRSRSWTISGPSSSR